MAAGLALLDALAGSPEMQRHHAFHAARAVTLEELGEAQEAAAAWQAAADFTASPVERGYAVARRGRLS